MTIALVGSIAATGNPGPTTGSLNTTGANFLAVYTSGSNASVTITDSKGNTWVDGPAHGIDPYGQWHWVVNPTVGSGHTFSNNGAFITMHVYAFSGADTTSPFDQESGVQGAGFTGGVDTQPGSITPANAGSLLLTGICGGPSGLSINLGFTIGFDVAGSGGVNHAGGSAYLIQGAAAATNPMWTCSGNVAGGILMVVFKPGAATGIDLSGPPPQQLGGPMTPAWQRQQRHGFDPVTTVAASGAATASIAVSASVAGAKGALGAARAAVAGDSRSAGAKGALGAASSSSAIGSKSAGAKGAIGAGKTHPAISSRSAGIKGALAAAKSFAAVVSTAAGTQASGITGAAKAAIAVFARAAGSKGAIGSASSSSAIATKAAGVKGGVGAAKSSIAGSTKTVGTKGAVGAAKASVAGSTKSPGVKGGVGAAKASIAGAVRSAGKRAANAAARVAVAIWSRVAGANTANLPNFAGQICGTWHDGEIDAAWHDGEIDAAWHAGAITATWSEEC